MDDDVDERAGHIRIDRGAGQRTDRCGEAVEAGSGTEADPYCSIQNAICNHRNDAGGVTIRVKPGTYKLAVTVTFEHDPGQPGPMAGFVEFGNMIQIYDPGN